MYTDKEIKEATQIAYLSFLEKASNNLRAEGKKGPFTIRELIFSCIDSNLPIKLAQKEEKDKSEIKIIDIVKNSDLKDEDKSIIEEFSEYMFEWKIIDMHDMNIINGFYACCIETSPEEAIVAFRGSENMRECSNMINDWMRADIGLLNSRGTRQQEEAEKYSDKILKNKILDSYKSIAVTGHSLGGNLATHFTISTATEARRTLFEKIKQSVNMDGPGVSDEYIRENQEKIKKAYNKLKHLKWSAVGNLLFDIPNEEIEFLAINEELHKDNLKERIKYKIITRHSTKSLIFNEEGKAERGKQDSVSKGLSLMSKAADKLIPEYLTTELFAAADWIFDKILKIKEGMKIELEDVSWEERFSKKGSLLGICGHFIKNTINVFKKGVMALRQELKSIGTNYKTPKLALADVWGASNANYGYNISSINKAKNVLLFEKEKSDIEPDIE